MQTTTGTAVLSSSNISRINSTVSTVRQVQLRGRQLQMPSITTPPPLLPIVSPMVSFLFFIHLLQLCMPSLHLCNRMIFLKVSAVAVLLVLHQSYFSSTKTASLHLNYSIELAEREEKVASEMLHCNDALIYVRSFTNLVDINHRSLAMAPLIFD